MAEPHPVDGPTPVPGPEPVTMETRAYILKRMQQIDVRSDGSATGPFYFDRKADAGEWVLWNQALDEARVAP